MTFSAFLCATQSDHSSAWVKTYMFTYAICAFLAPALASAAAFPWAIPEPTLAIPAIDSWSPAPTPPPRVGAIELFRRADDTVCGWISGSSGKLMTPAHSHLTRGEKLIANSVPIDLLQLRVWLRHKYLLRRARVLSPRHSWSVGMQHSHDLYTE